MSKKPETLFKEQVLADLKELCQAGGRVWAVKTQMIAVRGIPDLLLCVNGEFWALELKKDLKSKCSPLQKHILESIKTAGGRTSVESPETWPTTFKLIQRAALGLNKATEPRAAKH